MSGKSIYPSCISLSFSSLCARVLKFRNQGGEAHGKFSLCVYVQVNTCDICGLLFHWKRVFHITVVPSFMSDDGSHEVTNMCWSHISPSMCNHSSYSWHRNKCFELHASASISRVYLHRGLTEKTDQVTKWQIWDMIGIILKVGYFYQENFCMHDRAWMSILPHVKFQKSAYVEHTNILTTNTNGNAGQVNFTMPIWSILSYTSVL